MFCILLKLLCNLLHLFDFVSVVPLTTLLKRKPVDVEIDYLPSDKSFSKTKFLRQTSLPASQKISRLLPVENSSKHLNRLNSSPGHDKQKSEGNISVCQLNSFVSKTFTYLHL